MKKGRRIIILGGAVLLLSCRISAVMAAEKSYGYIHGINLDYSLKENVMMMINSKMAKKTVEWNGTTVILTSDKVPKLKYSVRGGVWTEIDTTVFAERDAEIKENQTLIINDIAVYGDQLYAVCDGGIMLVITPCPKCYKLKKICEFDIQSLEFEDTIVNINGKKGEIKIIPINDIRQCKISPDEALRLEENGAVIIDVREDEEYELKHYERSVNIPLPQIDNIKVYSQETTLIFCCAGGGRAETALKKAQEMGYINVYNAGGFEELLYLNQY